MNLVDKGLEEKTGGLFRLRVYVKEGLGNNDIRSFRSKVTSDDSQCVTDSKHL